MRLHGYCYRCHKVKLVRIEHIKRGGVQIGICAQCEEARRPT